MEGSGFAWPGLPYPALITAAGVAVLTALVIVVAHYFDKSGGLFTISVIIVLTFVAITLASMIYAIPQTAAVDLLIGALATSVGGIVSFWMSGSRRRHDDEDHDGDP